MDKDTIVIIDYGRGNLHSVYNGLLKIGASPVVSGDPKVIEAAPKVILPGVGSFGDCMDTMRSRGLEEAVQQALHSGKPFLGICLGEQLLFEGSEEAPGVKGLGYFKGQVKKIVTEYKIPHMGWNRITTVNPSPCCRMLTESTYTSSTASMQCRRIRPSLRRSAITGPDYGQRGPG